MNEWLFVDTCVCFCSTLAVMSSTRNQIGWIINKLYKVRFCFLDRSKLVVKKPKNRGILRLRSKADSEPAVTSLNLSKVFSFFLKLLL